MSARTSKMGLAAASLVATMLAVLSLSSCAPKPYGEHTLEEVNELAEKSGLVYESRISVGATGFPFEYQFETSVTLSASAASPENITAAVDYILRLAWAQTDADPTGVQSGGGGGFLSIIRPDGTSVDICSFAQEMKGDGFECGAGGGALEQLYGRWPGPLPTLPKQFAHLADSHCDDKNLGPYGAYTCGRIAQIATETIGEELAIKDMPNGDLEKTDLVIATRRIEPENLDYILRLSWSETSVEPTGDIILLRPSFFESTEENVFYIDNDYPFPCENVTPVGISGAAFDVACLEQFYGPWPGPLPEPPAPTTAAPTSTVPSPSPSPSS